MGTGISSLRSVLVSQLMAVRPTLLQLQDRSLVWNTDLLEACELDNLLTNAAITVHSAEARTVRRQHILGLTTGRAALFWP